MKKKKVVLNIVLVILVGWIGICGYFLYDNWKEQQIPAQQTELKPNLPEYSSEISTSGHPLMDFSELQATNSDIIGWLSIDDTVIDYPVVQGTDNSYYLNHTADKNTAKAGALFLDYRNTPDFSDPNNIIFGHNLKAGTMFGQLVQFKDKQHFDNHRYGWLYTPQKTYRIEIFAVCVVKSTGYPYTWAFESETAFMDFVNQINQGAKYQRDVEIRYGDRILTLSTCSYEYENARTVVCAKILE